VPKEIVVLSMRGAGKESYAGAAELVGLKAVSFDPSKPYEEGTIRTSTVFKFKGMESHVVVLTDLDKLESARDRRRAYVGMSRAKYALYLLGESEILAVIAR
jgi:superfamily I DNA/RNA helicase